MSYDASMDYVSLTYKRFADRYADYIGDVVKMTFYDDLQYNVPNRRMWDYSFNEVFEEKYGFDPAPYYPALWEYIGRGHRHYKALFMDCRAQMFASGFFKAVGDYTKRHGLLSMGHSERAEGRVLLVGLRRRLFVAQIRRRVGLDPSTGICTASTD